MNMKKKLILIITLTIFLFVSGGGSFAQEQDQSEESQKAVGTEGAGEGMTAREMVDYHIDLTRGQTSRGTMTMRVVTPDWERTIKMKWWEKGQDYFLVRVLKPERDAGNGTLKIENNLWNYVYKFDETIHIPPAMMMQSWMGSDFTNDDIVRESSLVEDYDHELEGVEEVEGERCYSILLTTDPTTAVPWLTMRIFLRTEDLLPVRKEFFDDDGNLARYMVFSDFKYMYDRVIPARMKMIPTDKEGEYTELEYIDVEFNVEIPDSTFTLQRLENPEII